MSFKSMEKIIIKVEKFKTSDGKIFDTEKEAAFHESILIGIKSNETIEAETKCYGENDQYWLKDLINTPKAWIEIKLPNGFLDSTEKQYIPIKISDLKFPSRKNERRYEYLVRIKFTMSNENHTLR